MRKAVYIFLVFVVSVGCSRNYDMSYVDGFNPKGSDSVGMDVDTSSAQIDRSRISRARIYPGLVSADAVRLNNQSVTFDLSVVPLGREEYRTSHPPGNTLSSGFYAPAGELIKINVPQGIYGLVCQIGAHDDNLSSIASPRRDPIIYTKQSLTPGLNYLRNPYGGVIWIEGIIPYQNAINLEFSGVVKMADFVLGVSNDLDWKQEVMVSKVPWLELRSPSIVFTVPTERVRNFIIQNRISSMHEVLLEWERVFAEDYYEWMGFSTDPNEPNIRHRKPKSPERIVLDIHPVVGYAHSGVPVVAQDDNAWLDEFVNINTITSGNSWGTAHEFGHNYQQTNVWSWDGMGETTNNLFVFKTANRNGVMVGQHVQVRAQFPVAVQNATERGGLDNASLKPNHLQAGNAFYKLVPFIQIFHKLRDLNNPSNLNFGWGFMPYLYRSAREAEFLSIADIDKRDFFYERLCEYAKRDMLPFFNAWDIKLSEYSKVKMSIKYPNKLSTKLWEYNPLNGQGGDSAF